MLSRQNKELSPREAAQRLGTTLQYLYTELWADRIPGARRSGRVWVIPEAAIRERLNRRGRKNG